MFLLMFAFISGIMMVETESKWGAAMCSPEKLTGLLEQLIVRLRELFAEHLREVILYGSYARGTADDGSDVDIMVLVDLPREAIVKYRRQVAEIAGDLLLTSNVLISPIVENQAFFARYRGELPFYRNIDLEGVRVSEREACGFDASEAFFHAGKPEDIISREQLEAYLNESYE